jgi:hypothetical protein
MGRRGEAGATRAQRVQCLQRSVAGARSKSGILYVCSALDCSMHVVPQLDTIGIKIGHLPLIPPFSLAFPSSLPITTPPSPNATRRTQDAAADKISQPDLLASISDREKFFELYIVVTNRAIDMYAKGGRRKFALKLHGSLAALDA